MTFNLEKLVRPNVRSLTPYSSARDEFTGAAKIFLDANENSFGSPLDVDYNRYPDPLQTRIKEKVAALNGVDASRIFVGNGSDEAIDLLFRVFCEPRVDNVVICPPTYGMYEVSAAINDAEVRRARLTPSFGLDKTAIAASTDANSKLLFICSPNNPTGNAFAPEEITEIARGFDGIVVVDEAYVHFSSQESMLARLGELPNLVVLQTFSKAWGLAGLRVGLAFASAEIIALLNRVKPPYNVSEIAQSAVLEALGNEPRFRAATASILAERAKLVENLSALALVKEIFPTDANFVLVRTDDPASVYNYLIEAGIIVRRRDRVELCEGCLRITVGTPAENDALIEALEKFEEK